MAKFDESLRWLSLHRIRTSYLQLPVKLFGREPCTSVFKYDVRLLCREGSAETFIKFCPSAAASQTSFCLFLDAASELFYE